MVEDFVPVQQPLGLNSCLSTAITSILNNLGCNVSPETVSDWCKEDPLGCFPDLTMEGLRDHDWQMACRNSEHEMHTFVNDPDNPTPVIALLKPDFDHSTDHAVV